MNSSCPECHSNAFKKNGYTRHGKQNYRCLECGRQFSQEPIEAFAVYEQEVPITYLLFEINS